MHRVHRLFYFLLFSLAVHAFTQPQNLVRERPILARQILPTPPSSSTAAPTSRPTATTSTASAPSSTRSADVSSNQSSSILSSTTAASSISSAPSETQRPVVTSANLSTDPEGRVSTSIITVTPTLSSSRTPTSTSNSDNASSGLGIGSIIGLSVAGGVALISVVAFLVWKLTRKRFSDFDDNEAIKWPELNTHGTDSHALPVHNTGRAGFDTGSETDVNNITPDPYAVPPLPHLNPNQPYRDDPAAVAPYYDPYRGPVPNAFNDTNSMEAPPGPGWSSTEAFPMTQMTRSRSPGPQMGYDMGMAGRRSPGPQVAYGQQPVYVDERTLPGRRSPGPQAAYELPNNMPR